MRHIALALLSFLLIANPAAARSPACTALSGGASQDITIDGTCRKITNNTGRSICVPTGNAQMWNSYITKTVANVNIESCGGGGGSSSGGSGGGGCFAAGTEITLADGTTKPIEDIKKGDMVMSFDTSVQWGPLTANPVNATIVKENQKLLRFNGSLLVTPDHKFPLGNGTAVEAGKLKKTDFFITDKGMPAPITAIEEVEAPATVYNIEVGGNHSYIADGVRTHNMIITSEAKREVGDSSLYKLDPGGEEQQAN